MEGEREREEGRGGRARARHAHTTTGLLLLVVSARKDAPGGLCGRCWEGPGKEAARAGDGMKGLVTSGTSPATRDNVN